MRINIKELKKLSEQLQIDLSEQELDSINNSIVQITDKLEEILKVDTKQLEPTISNIENEHNIEENLFLEDENLVVDMKKINNYDGTYVTISRGENE